MSHEANSLRSILFALGANFAIAVAKLIAALFTGSGSMMAESIHSMADTGNQLLLLFGIQRSGRAPDPDHPLGYGKALYFWSFIVALMLFSMGGMFSVYEGIHKIGAKEPLTSPWVAIGVLLFAFAAEGVSMWGCMREVNKIRFGQSLWRWFRETRQSDLMVVFGEDLAALTGLVFALIAVGLTILTGNPVFDAMGSIAIGLLLLVIAVMIGYEVKALLIGESVAPRIREEMKAFLQNRAEIQHVFSLLTLQLGNDVMVAVKARMTDMDSAEAMVGAINRCEADMKAAFPMIRWLFFEPDCTD